MSKKFNQFLRNAAKLGIPVGDINQATDLYIRGGGDNPNKKLNQFIRSQPTDGSAGDINQLSSKFLGKESAKPVTPPDPILPDEIKPTPGPRKISGRGSRLKIRKKSRRARSTGSGGTTSQRISLNTPASSAGGVNIGGG